MTRFHDRSKSLTRLFKATKTVSVYHINRLYRLGYAVEDKRPNRWVCVVVFLGFDCAYVMNNDEHIVSIVDAHWRKYGKMDFKTFWVSPRWMWTKV